MARELGMEHGAARVHPWARHMTDDGLADYLHGYVTRREGWRMRDGVGGWYDEAWGVAILRKESWPSSTAFRMTREQFNGRAVRYVRFT